MNEDLKFLTNFWFLSLLFLCGSMVFYYFFKSIFKFEKDKGWKKVEIIFLILSFISILGVCQRADAILNSIELESEMYRFSFIKGQIKEKISYMQGPSICREFIKNEFTPSNFDEVDRQYKFTCNFFKENASKISDEITAGRELSLDAFDQSKVENNRVIMQDIFHWGSIGKQYNQLMHSIKSKQENQPRGFSAILIVLSPMILTFALSLRMSKALAC